jgi:hypothetical protein
VNEWNTCQNCRSDWNNYYCEIKHEDLDLFRLLFCRDTGTNQLTINSEHRLPRVLDDQILM